MDDIEKFKKRKDNKKISVVEPRGSISSSVAPVLSAAKTNWQSWMHILAELCSSPQNEDTQPHIKFEIPSGGCGFGQTATMCVILNCSSLRFHRLYCPVLFRSYMWKFYATPTSHVVSPVTYYIATRWSNSAWIVNELVSCFCLASVFWLVTCLFDDITQEKAHWKKRFW